jgi:hypothetical protein
MFVPSSARRRACNPSPEGPLARPRLLPRQRKRPDETASSRPTDTPLRWVKLVPAFVVAFVLGTTRARERACHCLAARSPDIASAPTCGTLPDCGISNTRPTKPGTGYHSGRRSPSQVSDALRPISHVARRCHPPGRSPYVPGSRPGIVSADEAISPGRN